MAAKQHEPLAIIPGKGLGFLLLGGALRDILTRLRSRPDVFPKLKIQFAAATPLTESVHIVLPENGLRLRFDGSDQRLRLIEVLDFSKISLTYKGQDLVKTQDHEPVTGPSFRHVYSKLLGPTFEGEHFKPSPGSSSSLYVLSYPGIAFSFNVIDWPENSDFVSVLSSASASSAIALSIFNGSSWKDARKDLYTRSCPHPRSLSLAGRPKESMPDEIEVAIIKGNGHVEFKRRLLPSFNLLFGETTSQDLVLTLGPPDAIYRKHDRRLSIHKEKATHRHHHDLASSPQDRHLDTDRSSISTATDYSSGEDGDDGTPSSSNTVDQPSQECFYNYFSHGFDIFMSYQVKPSSGLLPTVAASPDVNVPRLEPVQANESQYPKTSTHLVATKLILHGNVPGSHSFNRHRRSRWMLDTSILQHNPLEPLTSETDFSSMRSALNEIWSPAASPPTTAGTHITSYLPASTIPPERPQHQHHSHAQRYMVLNRSWGSSPGSSISLLGGWEDDEEDEGEEDEKNGRNDATDANQEDVKKEKNRKKSAMGNTELHGWPGLLFEVLKNDAIDCLTVY